MSSADGFLPLVRDQWGLRTKAAQYRADPVLWMNEVGGFFPWSKQREMFYSVRDNRATAVAASHASGKSLGASWLIAWWLDVYPVEDIFVATTAPTADQLDIIWGALRQIYSRIERRYNDGLIDHKLPGRITGDNKIKLDNGKIIAEGRKPPDNRADVAWQGRHSPYLLAVADEGVGVPAGFLDAMGNIATGRNNRQLILANPTDPTSAMAKIWREENPNWYRMHISVYDAPTMKPEEGFDPDALAEAGMAGQEYIDQKLSEYGSEDDPRFIARVLGQWAFDAGNNVFTAEEIANGHNTVVVPDPEAIPELGCDIARGGKDSSTVYMMLRGKVWETDDKGDPVRATDVDGMMVRKIGEWRKAPLTGNDPENLGTAQRIHQHALAEGARFVKVDAAGMGASVIDGLAEIARTTVMPYTWFEVFGQATKDVDTRAYTNTRAHHYFLLKKMLHEGTLDIDPKDEELAEELQGIVYEYDARGRIKIESKDDMKRRGVKSPDHADALWYSIMDISPALIPTVPARQIMHRDEWDFDEYDAPGLPR